jgi:hypothetical protein
VEFVATGGTVGKTTFSKGITSLQLTLAASGNQFMLSFTNVTSGILQRELSQYSNSQTIQTPNL